MEEIKNHRFVECITQCLNLFSHLFTLTWFKTLYDFLGWNTKEDVRNVSVDLGPFNGS